MNQATTKAVKTTTHVHQIIMKLFLLYLIASTVAAFSPAASLRSITLQQPASSLQTNHAVLSSRNNKKYTPLHMADDKGVEEKQDETKKGFEAIKSAGRAGAISLFLWEAAFWIIAGEFHLPCTVS
jgi:hypothetical protein